MDKSMTEKILSSKVGRDVSPGDIVVAPVDLVYMHDGTAPLIIKNIEEVLALGRVFDNKKVILVIDHVSPPSTVVAATIHKHMRAFASKFGLKLFDVGEGICHQVIAESGLVEPRNVVIGADSHTTTLGALGAFATGVGSTDASIAIATGKIWLKVPEVMLIKFTGILPKAVMGKDVILYIISIYGVNGFNYKSIEFSGEGLKNISMDSRLTISNMSTEMGAKAALFPVDHISLEWYKSIGVKVDEFYPDPKANYEDEAEIELSRIEPLVSIPPKIDNIKAVSELEGIETDVVFIGSCTNGRYEDFLTAARILRGRKVKTRCIAIPASMKVYRTLLAEGIVNILVNAGCYVAFSTCGPCPGAHMGLLAEGETVVSTSNRNFPGRMGHKDSKIYLASPATAAATAINGKITDPRTYLEGVT